MKLSSFLLSAFLYIAAQGQVAQNIIIEPGPGGKCLACDSPYLVITLPVANNIVINANNTVKFTQPITIALSPAKLITSVKAELTYFEFVPESDECMACNKTNATFGNIISGSVAAITGIVTDNHTLSSNFPAPRSQGSFPTILTVSLPPTVKCCNGVVRWCIRYVFSFDDCTVCTKVVCYQKNKTNATPSIQTTNSN